MIFYIDGSCEPTNPGGYACCAWVAFDCSGERVAEYRGYIGHGDGMTNNLAEYCALIAALGYASENGISEAIFRSDSKLVVEQTNGRWQVNSPNLIPLSNTAKFLLSDVKGILEWLPREQNKDADALMTLAYREAMRNAH